MKRKYKPVITILYVDAAIESGRLAWVDANVDRR